ncbi:MAG TPA: LpxD N-terminal domain-containing protein, partial [Vicinamibacterales bacterium]|nr:LpxD N-terminal domain-containing protein [Vicinamibacterales bacterium]
MTLRELADRLECRLEGDGDLEVTRVSGIQDAQPGDITFLANPKYEKALASTRASAVILKEDAKAAPCAMLRARDPYLAFARAVGLFAPVSRPAPGVHTLAAIASNARLGADVSIGPFVVIGEGARIGDRTVIYP